MEITERDLVLPALYVIKRKGSATTTDLIKELTIAFNPTGEDAKILDQRNDTKFSQKVRNLRSHRSNNGMSNYVSYVNGVFRLTSAGENYLATRIEELDYFFSQKFDYDDTTQMASKMAVEKQKIIVYNENELISEGAVRNKEARNRSKKLREAAISYYTQDGKLRCEICGFCFSEKYGQLGEGYIDIHHIKPICQYSANGVNEFIKNAVKDVRPVCANCHRMIHRDPKKPLSMEELKAIVNPSP